MNGNTLKAIGLAYSLKAGYDKYLPNEIEHVDCSEDEVPVKEPFNYVDEIEQLVTGKEKTRYNDQPQSGMLYRDQDYEVLENKIIQALLGTWIAHGLVPEIVKKPSDGWVVPDVNTIDDVIIGNYDNTVSIEPVQHTIRTKYPPKRLVVWSRLDNSSSDLAYVIFNIRWGKVSYTKQTTKANIYIISYYAHEIAQQSFYFLRCIYNLWSIIPNPRDMYGLYSTQWLLDVKPIEATKEEVGYNIPVRLAKLLRLPY